MTQSPGSSTSRPLRPTRANRSAHCSPICPRTGRHRRSSRRRNGFLFFDRERFPASFAADVSPREAAFMAGSQVPWGVDALNGTISDPAWRSKPSWYLIVTEDRMIPPPLQRTMAERAGATTAEVPGSHAIYVSQPSAIAGLITQAATAVGAPAGALS
ncbi:MAG: alpha/beta hydrolase [Solirubrobacteraceae bacterium]